MRGGGAQFELRGVQRFLNRASAGRVVKRGGERQAGAFGQREHILHQALAEARLADDGGAVVILQGAGHDFGSAGGLLVDQHGQRELIRRGDGGNVLDFSATLRPRTVTILAPG